MVGKTRRPICSSKQQAALKLPHQLLLLGTAMFLIRVMGPWLLLTVMGPLLLQTVMGTVNVTQLGPSGPYKGLQNWSV